MAFDYAQKFASFQNQGLYHRLDEKQQEFIRALAFKHRFSFQEFRQVVEASRDLAMWEEEGLETWWQGHWARGDLEGVPLKKKILKELQEHLLVLRAKHTRYPKKKKEILKPRKVRKIITEKTEKNIIGPCPVASPKTVCCNLITIDSVENCSFGCSYCTIQTFYQDETRFDQDFVKKLGEIELDPDRFYHIGTGQASDSLVWGDRNHHLTALCEFAADHPNILLEFKTKSNNVRFFLENDIPRNVVCSWSLNTPTIVENEEHFTATLEQRLESARRLADRGIPVAFHFHPMVYYEGWERGYAELAGQVMERFTASEVLFLSFGTLTFIKPVMQKIRELGRPTKILQMELVPDPHGKLTYPDEIKIKLFKNMYEAFRPWQELVFMYLCMEKASLWEEVFGFVYNDNDQFERDFGQKTLGRISRQ